MKRSRALPILAVAVGMVILAMLTVGCAVPTTAQGSQTAAQATPTATMLPTATPRPKPTKVPAITTTFCQQVLSVAQANQITQPPSAATSIRAQGSAGGGSCNYEYSPLHDTVSLFFGKYPGGTLSELASQALLGSMLNGKMTASEAVSGLGDQAYFGVATSSLSLTGVTISSKEQALFVVDGAVVFEVSAELVNGAGGIGKVSDTQALTEFKQIAQLILAQL